MYADQVAADMTKTMTNTDEVLELVSELNSPAASLVILEQPASNRLRFRYEVESRGAGALQGENSQLPDMKTFPKVQLLGYKGPAKVVVSCVTNEPERPKAHPHMLVSPPRVRGCRESLPAKDGICVASVTNPDMTVEFQHLGIQCKKKNEVEQSLEQRRKLRIDPYGQGFDHGCSKNKARSIDLNAVKLCFQAYLFNPDTGRLDKKLDPVCSNPIFNPRTVKELQIVDLSHDVAPAEGGKKMIILCEGVNKDDVRVRFFQDDNNWEGFGVFTPDKVHKQCAISLATPPYTLAVLARPKQVWVELTKLDGSSASNPVKFYLTPSKVKKEMPQSSATRGWEEQVYTEVKGEQCREQGDSNRGNGTTFQQLQATHTTTQQVIQLPETNIITSSTAEHVNNYNHNSNVGQWLSGQSHSMNYNYNNDHYHAPSQTTLYNSAKGQEYIETILGTDNVDNISEEFSDMAIQPLRIRLPGKRDSRTANNDSASNVLPRTFQRQQSSTLNTPETTGDIRLASGDMRDCNTLLRNCSSVNTLD